MELLMEFGVVFLAVMPLLKETVIWCWSICTGLTTVLMLCCCCLHRWPEAFLQLGGPRWAHTTPRHTRRYGLDLASWLMLTTKFPMGVSSRLNIPQSKLEMHMYSIIQTTYGIIIILLCYIYCHKYYSSCEQNLNKWLW